MGLREQFNQYSAALENKVKINSPTIFYEQKGKKIWWRKIHTTILLDPKFYVCLRHFDMNDVRMPLRLMAIADSKRSRLLYEVLYLDRVSIELGVRKVGERAHGEWIAGGHCDERSDRENSNAEDRRSEEKKEAQIEDGWIQSSVNMLCVRCYQGCTTAK